MHQYGIALQAKHTNTKNKQKTLFPLKKRKRKNPWARFPLCTPKGLSLEEKQHMQEVRWDVRKAFSGSIWQAGEGKGDRQTERVRERGTQSPGEREVLGEQPVLFKSTVTLLTQSW